MSLKNGPWQVCFQNSNFEMKENNTNRCLEQQKLFSLSWKRIKKFTLINFFFVFIFRVYSWRMQSVSNITTEFWKEKKSLQTLHEYRNFNNSTFFCKMDFCCFNFFSIRLYVYRQVLFEIKRFDCRCFQRCNCYFSSTYLSTVLI
jgi:hypothetical protein